MDTETREPGDRIEAPGMRRIAVVVTDELTDSELLDELCRNLPADRSKVVLVAPAVEETVFQHALGDVDTATRKARRRLDRSLSELRRRGVPALGEVGDSDPVVAAGDALRQYPADEVLIVAHSADQARWFEDGLLDRAEESLYPPVRMIVVHRDEDGEAHVAGVRRAAKPDRDLSLSQNLPDFTRGDLAGIVLAIAGTIVAIILAAAGPGSESAAGAAQILIAMAVALINMAHVVGLLLLESVHYRGGWQRFLRNLSLVGTPAAIVANLLLTVLS